MAFFSKLFRYMIKRWHLLAFIIICISLTTVLNVYIPQIGGQVIRNIILIGDYNALIWLVLQIIGFTAASGVLSFLLRYLNGYFSQSVLYEIRNDAFESIQRQSLAFFDRTGTGQLMSRVTTDTERIGRFLGGDFRMLIETAFLLTGVVTSMVIIDWQLTIISFCLVSLILVTFLVFGKKVRPIISKSREHYANITSVLWENISGIRVVRAFGMEDYERSKFHKPNNEYYEAMMTATSLRATFLPLTGLIGGLVTVTVYWLGGIRVIEGQFGIDMLYVFSSYVSMLIRPMSMLGNIWSGYQQMAAAGERVFQIIEQEPEVKDKPDAIEMEKVRGHIKFENVSFGYDPNKPVLKNISFEVKPGETVALLGPTGSGKSTIIHLLLRFYDVSSGRILVDGYDIRDVKLKSLRRHIGVVSQEVFLFNKTVKENISFGKPNATFEEIVRAAEKAQAHEFIMKLPNGYDTIIGERGIILSGGQRQRIAIARALLVDPKILILDDSTSSVDVDTEYEIQKALAELLKNRTTLVITQRISTIRNADKIIVIDNGEIVEDGDHETLMQKRGVYYRLYETLYEAQRDVLEAIAKRQMREIEQPMITEHNVGG
ncbi:MAG: ABC transporter ATP-binding protein [Nitrososphaerota archaeon]|nr:ABC transporter ATP-binding protein/permease [Candidatus Bathyarchaeota archaeon]MDW8049071.1 ABC transporter ATP-binding protein [Nitrososphaerota archaeon]